MRTSPLQIISLCIAIGVKVGGWVFFLARPGTGAWGSSEARYPWET